MWNCSVILDKCNPKFLISGERWNWFLLERIQSPLCLFHTCYQTRSRKLPLLNFIWILLYILLEKLWFNNSFYIYQEIIRSSLVYIYQFMQDTWIDVSGSQKHFNFPICLYFVREVLRRGVERQNEFNLR